MKKGILIFILGVVLWMDFGHWLLGVMPMYAQGSYGSGFSGPDKRTGLMVNNQYVGGDTIFILSAFWPLVVLCQIYSIANSSDWPELVGINPETGDWFWKNSAS